MTSLKTELIKKCKLCTLIGLGLGILLGLTPDSKSAVIYGPVHLVIRVVEGIVFGSILGLLYGTISYAYEKSSWLRPIAGAFLCFTVGFFLVTFWGFILEADRAWELRTPNRSQESIRLELALRDGIWGGLIGAGLGLMAGTIDKRLHRNKFPDARPA